MFWADTWKIEFFIWKMSSFGGKIFSIFEKACFRNGLNSQCSVSLSARLLLVSISLSAQLLIFFSAQFLLVLSFSNHGFNFQTKVKTFIVHQALHDGSKAQRIKTPVWKLKPWFKNYCAVFFFLFFFLKQWFENFKPYFEIFKPGFKVQTVV